MDTIEVRFRTWYKGLPPQPIKLKIPGWAGKDHNHGNGAEPQPWHCPPFVEGSTYGLELLYPFENTCKVVNEDGKVRFEGDFSNEIEEYNQPPFDVFAPGHYGFTSSLDIVGPPNHIIRLEPHPRYYTDDTWTCPCVVPGHIQSEWWSRIFFIVFKAPPVGCHHIFRYKEPYAQILVLPKKVSYEIYPMDHEENKQRTIMDSLINKSDKGLADNCWVDNLGHHFNDKYKVMARMFAKGGCPAVEQFVRDKVQEQEDDMKAKTQASGKRMKRRLVAPSHEKLQDQTQSEQTPTLPVHCQDRFESSSPQGAASTDSDDTSPQEGEGVRLD